MGEGLHYFIFNKSTDYRRGYLKNMEVDGGTIRPERGIHDEAVFISRLLDSLEAETIWHRLKIRRELGLPGTFRLSVYAGNQNKLFFEGGELGLEELIQRNDIPLEEKRIAMAPWLQKEVTGKEDVLLHEVRGRYLWIMIEMYPQQTGSELADIQIYFPRRSWIEYLPEIYQREDRDGFLERYLGIFQTIYEDLNDEIRAVSKRFDVDLTEKQYLAWLAQWLGIGNGHIWSEKQLRRLLKEGVGLYKRRGTRQGITDFVALYTGEAPFLVEGHQLSSFRGDKERIKQLHRLYTDNPLSLTVLVREEVIHSRQQQKALTELLEEVKPVQLELNLILLKPYIFVGRYSYLGINSVLGSYRNMRLDGHSAVPFAVLEDEGGSDEKF